MYLDVRILWIIQENNRICLSFSFSGTGYRHRFPDTGPRTGAGRHESASVSTRLNAYAKKSLPDTHARAPAGKTDQNKANL